MKVDYFGMVYAYQCFQYYILPLYFLKKKLWD